MAWTIEFARSAEKDLTKLERRVAQRILRFLKERVAADPRSTGEPLSWSCREKSLPRSSRGRLRAGAPPTGRGSCPPRACVARPRPARAGASPAGPPCFGSLPLAAAALHGFRYPLAPTAIMTCRWFCRVVSAPRRDSAWQPAAGSGSHRRGLISMCW